MAYSVSDNFLFTFAVEDEDTGQRYLLMMNPEELAASFLEVQEGEGLGRRTFREVPQAEADPILASVKAAVLRDISMAAQMEQVGGTLQ